MSVRDFMTKNVITVHSAMPIFDAIDLMKKHDIHRLPVVDQQRLVGLITEGTIAEAMPSKATSLSVYEMNYLLNKTTVADIMLKKVTTIKTGGAARRRDCSHAERKCRCVACFSR